MCDILGEILRAAVLVGLRETACISFKLEPGEERYVLDYEWFDREERYELRIRRLSFEDLLDGRPAEEGELSFEARLSDPDEFCRAALALGDRVARDHGMDGYMQLWDPKAYPFPLRAVTALRSLLSTEDPPLDED